MSSNLTLEAKLKYQEYLDAKTIEDRIQKLQEFISAVPKHKATEKIVALNKSRLSKLRAEQEETLRRKKAITASRAAEDPFVIKREAHTIQINLVSDYFEPIGVGKTLLMKQLTGISNGRVDILTTEPLVGIFDWENIPFQLIEQPALHDWQFITRVMGTIRTTDFLWIVIDLTRDPILQMQHILKYMEDNSLYLNVEPPAVKWEKTGSGGIQIFYMSKEAEENLANEEFIIEIIQESGVKNATVKIFQKLTIQEVEMAFNRASEYIPSIIIGTKADIEGSKANFQILQEKYGLARDSEKLDLNNVSTKKFPIFPVAIKFDDNGNLERQGLEKVGESMLSQLNLVRIYTKSKKGIAKKPLIVPRDSTIAEVAKKIHKDLYNTFKYANVFRQDRKVFTRTKIKAGLNFVIQEFDVVEIHSRI